MDKNQFLAWVAGFFEGEGTISVETGNMRIYQKDTRVLKEIQKRLGGTLETRVMDRITGRQCSHLIWCGSSARHLCSLLKSFFPCDTDKSIAVEMLAEKKKRNMKWVQSPSEVSIRKMDVFMNGK
jgi:hypothetical protein